MTLNFGDGSDCYTHVASSLKVNGWLTVFIPLQRGLRQGCALSMPLYVLTAEILATHNQAHPNITGLQHPASQLTISQYADDTTLLLADDESITDALKVFEVYEKAYGAKLTCKNVKAYGVALTDTGRMDLPTLTGLIHIYQTNYSEFTLVTLTAQTKMLNTKYINWGIF